MGVFNTTEPTVPLLLNEKSTLFKLFLSDVGLLTTIYGKACKLKIVSKEKDINKGAVYENVVAQELHATAIRCTTTTARRRVSLTSWSSMWGRRSPSR